MRHVHLTCLHHPNLRWTCKSIATSKHGGYNGCRNIFFQGDVTRINTDGYYIHAEGVSECKCPPSDLILAPDETWDDECKKSEGRF